MGILLWLILSFMSLVVIATDLDDLAALLVNPKSFQFQLMDNATVSMDGAHIFKNQNKYYSVYHHNIPGTDNWNIILAEANDLFGPWSQLQVLVENIGSMPYMHHDEATDYFILAFEQMDSSDGNFPSFYFYSSFEDLLASRVKYKTSLNKNIHLPASDNSYTKDAINAAHNIGTPTITSAQYLDYHVWVLYIRFHYTTKTNPNADTCGYGVVSFNPSKEADGTVYDNWQGYFDNDANNAIEVARDLQGGKIGQRASTYYKGKIYYLFEAQLTSEFDWHNWRIFLYSPSELRAIQLPLNIEGVVDFANPSLTVLEEEGLIAITLFVPSEAINANTSSIAKPGELMYTIPLY